MAVSVQTPFNQDLINIYIFIIQIIYSDVETPQTDWTQSGTESLGGRSHTCFAHHTVAAHLVRRHAQCVGALRRHPNLLPANLCKCLPGNRRPSIALRSMECQQQTTSSSTGGTGRHRRLRTDQQHHVSECDRRHWLHSIPATPTGNDHLGSGDLRCLRQIHAHSLHFVAPRNVQCRDPCR